MFRDFRRCICGVRVISIRAVGLKAPWSKNGGQIDNGFFDTICHKTSYSTIFCEQNILQNLSNDIKKKAHWPNGIHEALDDLLTIRKTLWFKHLLTQQYFVNT